jgi:hypothetical protein
LVILRQNEQIFDKIIYHYKLSSFVEFLRAQAIRVQSVN